MVSRPVLDQVTSQQAIGSDDQNSHSFIFFRETCLEDENCGEPEGTAA
jgi:hypothetical protein